jgi:RNA polymerase sigma factor (sigma-70 family)
MDDPSDAALLAAYSAGDPRAFTGLVERHQGGLLRHARALLADWRGGEDVVQEVFLRLARKPPEIPASALGNPVSERAVLGSWLHRVTRNLCMDTLRSEKRRRRREEAVAPTEATAGGLDGVEAEDTRRAVEASLTKLSTDQREVLVLRLFGDKSYKEIAAITGKKVGTIGWLVSVGLKSQAAELAPLVAIADSSRPARGSSAPGTQVKSLPGGMG